MSTTLAIPGATATVIPQQATRERDALGRRSVLLAAGVALIAKLLIAWNTIGTNDVISFYHFGKSLTGQGLESTYVSDVAFNHPPLVAAFIQHLSIGSRRVAA